MLKNNEISPMQFLKTMANQKNRVLYADSDISESTVEVDLALQSELYGNVDTAKYQEVDEWIDSDLNMIDEIETAATLTIQLSQESAVNSQGKFKISHLLSPFLPG